MPMNIARATAMVTDRLDISRHHKLAPLDFNFTLGCRYQTETTALQESALPTLLHCEWRPRLCLHASGFHPDPRGARYARVRERLRQLAGHALGSLPPWFPSP